MNAKIARRIAKANDIISAAAAPRNAEVAALVATAIETANAALAAASTASSFNAATRSIEQAANAAHVAQIGYTHPVDQDLADAAVASFAAQALVEAA